jgi:hypothetical protein
VNGYETKRKKKRWFVVRNEFIVAVGFAVVNG